MPSAIRGLAIAAIALATLDLLIGVVLAILAFAELAGGTALMWAGVLVCQAGFLGEFALLLAGGILLLRGDARGRTLALVHALSVIPVFLAGTIGIRIVESLDAMREARERPAMWLLAAPFAGIFAVVLLLMLNRPAVRAWAHRRRLARAQVEPATLPPERRDGLPVSELALWSAVIAWMPFPPLLAQMTACGLGIAGLVVTRRGRHGGRGYAVYGLALSGLALASVLAAFIAFLCWKKQG